MIYVLESDFDRAPQATLRTAALAELDLRWMEGHMIPAGTVPEILEVVAERHHDHYPDYFDAGHGPVVSERFREVLSTARVDNCDFYPALILEDGRPVARDRFVMNVVGRVACIDLDRSEYTEWEGALFRMKSMALRDDVQLDLRVFRPHEYPEIILIDESVAEALQGAGLTGAKISVAEGWGDHERF